MNFKLLLLLALASTPLAMSSCAPIGVPYASAYYNDGYNDGGYVTSLPYGYQTVYVSSTPYFFYNNSWYRRNNGRYYRTSRPLGYKGKLGRVGNRGYLTRLPSGYSPYTIGGIRYYNSGSSWYTYRGGRYYPSARPANFRSSLSRNNIRSNRLNRGNSRTVNRNTTVNRRVRSGSLTKPANATRLRAPRSTATNRATAQRTSSQRATRQNVASQRAANQATQRAQRATSAQTNATSGSTQRNSTQRRGRFFRSNR